MFDIDNIATLSGIDKNSIRAFLPDILNAIRNYTHKSFITDVSISGNIIINDNNQIIIEGDIPEGIIPESQIELRYSNNNTRIYTIKSIENNIIETYEKLFAENFNGFLIKLSFKNIDNTMISSMASYKQSSINSLGVKSESVDGYNYTLDTDSSNDGFPLSIMKSFNSLRQLSGSEKLEYYRMGYVK